MDFPVKPPMLVILGFRFVGGVWVLYSNPRIGWKPDGTLIVGYHEWKEKVTDLAELLAILEKV